MNKSGFKIVEGRKLRYTIILHDINEIVEGEYEEYANYNEVIIFKKKLREKQ